MLFQSSATILVNSQDWEDVYSGSSYAQEEGERVFYTKTEDAQGVLDLLPRNKPVTIVQSTENPYVGNLQTVLETRGYTVEETVEISDGPTELYQEETKDIVVIDKGSPASAVIAASLANNKDAWPLVISNENLEDSENILQSAEEVTMVGLFGRETGEMAREYADEEFSNPNRFGLAKDIAEEVLKLNPDSESMYITDGRVIEQDLMESERPVLLSGTNFPPEEVISFVLDNKITSGVIVGARLTTVGEDLKDEVEKEDREISLFVKYGTARGDQSQIQSLNSFPLPRDDVELLIESAQYDPSSKELYVTYTNEGSSSLFMISTMTVEDEDGNDIGSAGDNETSFIGADSSTTKSYSIDLQASEAENASVRFTTSYGSQRDNLDTYVSPEEEGVFGPPYVIPMTVEEINDESQVELGEIKYLQDVSRFKLNIENTGETDAYVSASLLNVIKSGRESTFTTKETIKITEGESKEVYIPAELDRIDLEENDMIQASISFGERKGALVNNLAQETEFKASSGSIPIIGSFTQSPGRTGVIILAILVIAGLFYFRDALPNPSVDLKSKLQSENDNEGYSYNE